MSVRSWPVIGVVLAVLWLAVRGVELAPDRIAAEGLIGLAIGGSVAYGLRRMYVDEVDVVRAVTVAPTAARYVTVFLWEVLTANLDVAYRVLHPSMPIEPDVVEVPLRVQSDAAITTIANSITLTPGTLTMDHDPETNTLYVHGIVGTRREAVLAPIRQWEDLLLECFDEEADPAAEPPAPPSQRAPKAPDPEDEDHPEPVDHPDQVDHPGHDEHAEASDNPVADDNPDGDVDPEGGEGDGR